MTHKNNAMAMFEEIAAEKSDEVASTSTLANSLPMPGDFLYLEELAEDIRTSTFETILHAKSGHLGACSSSAELMTALYFGGILRFNPKDPKWVGGCDNETHFVGWEQ